MRNPFMGIIIALLAVLAFSSVAMAQAGAGLDNSLYTQLGKNDRSGGPAPVHDVNGDWTGPLEAKRGDPPPMTPLGQKLYNMNKTEAGAGWADSNDPWKTCDTFGFPRSAVNEIRGISFAQMPGKIVVLHNYNKVFREIWMDGRELPKNMGHKGGPDGHYQERYTRTDRNHLEMTVTVDDPKIYTKPFVLGTSSFRWVPKQELEEQICIPSEAISYVNTISIPAAGEGPKSK
jgi:hypothetical protein